MCDSVGRSVCVCVCVCVCVGQTNALRLGLEELRLVRWEWVEVDWSSPLVADWMSDSIWVGGKVGE